MLKDQLTLGKVALAIAYALVLFSFWAIIPSYTYTTAFWKDVYKDVKFDIVNSYGPREPVKRMEHD